MKFTVFLIFLADMKINTSNAAFTKNSDVKTMICKNHARRDALSIFGKENLPKSSWKETAFLEMRCNHKDSDEEWQAVLR